MIFASLPDRPSELSVLLVAEHASLQFGGEAALPLHYFRVLRKRCKKVHLITHARVRNELERQFPDDQSSITYIEDSLCDRHVETRQPYTGPPVVLYFRDGLTPCHPVAS